MYKRLRDGLLAPKTIIEYIKDKGWKPFVQLLLYSIILIIPLIINIFNYKGLAYEDELIIRKDFSGEVIPYKTVDGRLIQTSGDNTYYFKHDISENLSIVFNTNDTKVVSNQTLTVVFSDNKISLYSMNLLIADLCTYKDFEGLMNFDFTKLANTNDIESWDIVFDSANLIIKAFMKSTIVSVSFIYLIIEGISLLLFALLLSLSFYFRFRNVLKYSAMLKMSIYYTAPYVVCTLFANLFHLTALNLIGVLISIIYTFVGSGVIISRLMNQNR